MLPAWALEESTSPGDVIGRRIGRNGRFGTLYAACRAESLDSGYVRAFTDIARRVSSTRLRGIWQLDDGGSPNPP